MSTKLQLHKVLRPIFIGGERIEVDGLVELGPVLGAELRHAGKVALCEDPEATAQAKAKDPAQIKPAEPAPRVRKAKPEPAAEAPAPADPAPEA